MQLGDEGMVQEVRRISHRMLFVSSSLMLFVSSRLMLSVKVPQSGAHELTDAKPRVDKMLRPFSLTRASARLGALQKSKGSWATRACSS